MRKFEILIKPDENGDLICTCDINESPIEALIDFLNVYNLLSIFAAKYLKKSIEEENVHTENL